MKTTIFLLLIWSVLPLSGQSLSNQVLANGGQSMQSSQGATISWTIGELFTSTKQYKGTLTQGFHQGYNIEVTSLHEIQAEMAPVLIYPNPAFDHFFVEATDASQVLRARLFNLVGQPLQQFQFNGKIEVKLASYPSGIYLLEIQNDAGQQAIYKIQKQN